MYLYHSDTQRTGPQELERPGGNRLHCYGFLCDLCQVFDWKSAHLMQPCRKCCKKELELAFYSF